MVHFVITSKKLSVDSLVWWTNFLLGWINFFMFCCCWFSPFWIKTISGRFSGSKCINDLILFLSVQLKYINDGVFIRDDTDDVFTDGGVHVNIITSTNLSCAIIFLNSIQLRFNLECIKLRMHFRDWKKYLFFFFADNLSKESNFCSLETNENKYSHDIEWTNKLKSNYHNP